MEENKLIKYESVQLVKVGNAITITNKLLAENFTQEQKLLISFLLRNANKEDFAYKLISGFYPLSLKQIEENNVFFRNYSRNNLFDFEYYLIRIAVF